MNCPVSLRAAASLVRQNPSETATASESKLENSEIAIEEPFYYLNTILFEIITYFISRPLNHVTVIAENSWEYLRGNYIL